MDHTVFYLVPEPIEMKIEMFHVTVMFRIFGDSDGTLVVHLESGRKVTTIPKLKENVSHPRNLLPSFNSSHILCLSGRKRNNGLQLAIPSNCTTSYHRHISSSRASGINIITMGGIRVSDERLSVGQITLVGEFVVEGTLDVAEKMFERFPVLWTRM